MEVERPDADLRSALLRRVRARLREDPLDVPGKGPFTLVENEVAKR